MKMRTERVRKKRRMKHPPSILHQKDGTCYLCGILHGNYRIYPYLEKHHVFPGKPGRRISEENGFTVWLCPEHHRIGNAAVHNNINNLRLIQRQAQTEYEKTHTRGQWMALMGRNYL